MMCSFRRYTSYNGYRTELLDGPTNLIINIVVNVYLRVTIVRCTNIWGQLASPYNHHCVTWQAGLLIVGVDTVNDINFLTWWSLLLPVFFLGLVVCRQYYSKCDVQERLFPFN